MGLFRSRVSRRFPLAGLLSDLALVGATASRLARRRTATGPTGTLSGVEVALAGGAAFRLLQRLVRRRRARRRTRAIDPT